MRGNIDNFLPLLFVPVDFGSFVVAGGAAGWIDTDVSATTGTNPSRIWLVIVNAAANQVFGARRHGATANPIAAGLGASMLSTVDSAGHMDLYRDAANNTYYIVGYLDA